MVVGFSLWTWEDTVWWSFVTMMSTFAASFLGAGKQRILMRLKYDDISDLFGGIVSAEKNRSDVFVELNRVHLISACLHSELFDLGSLYIFMQAELLRKIMLDPGSDFLSLDHVSSASY